MKNFTSIQDVDNFFKNIEQLHFLEQMIKYQDMILSCDKDDKDWIIQSIVGLQWNKLILDKFNFYCNEKNKEFGHGENAMDLFYEIMDKLKNGMSIKEAEEYLESVLVMNKLIE